MLLPSSLEDARVTALPPSCFYIPGFISEEEEELILSKVRLMAKIFAKGLVSILDYEREC
jgi:hypothetical protein